MESRGGEFPLNFLHVANHIASGVSISTFLMIIENMEKLSVLHNVIIIYGLKKFL